MRLDLVLFCLSQMLAAAASTCLYFELATWLTKVATATTLGTTIGSAIILRIALGPVTGPIGDRLSRARLTLGSHAWSAIMNAGIIALTATASTSHIAPVIALYMLLNAGKAINDTVTPALLAELVPKAEIPFAVQVSNAALTVAGAISGVAYGAAVEGASDSTALYVRAFAPIAAGLAALAILAVRPKHAVDPSSGTAGAPAPATLWRDARAGLAFVWERPLLLQLAAASMLMFSVLGPLTVALPGLIKEHALPAWVMGAAQTAGSAGALLGVAMAGFARRRLPTLATLVAAMALGGVATALAGYFAAGPLAAYLLVLALGLVPLAVNLAFVTFIASLTMALEAELQSRVIAIFTFMVAIGVPLGMFVSGPAIEAFGTAPALVACGIGMCVVAPMWFLVPRLREFCRLDADAAAAFLRDAEAVAPAELLPDAASR